MTASESDRIRHLENRVHVLECKILDINEELKILGNSLDQNDEEPNE